MLADGSSPTTLTFKAVDAVTRNPVSNLHVTVTSRGAGQFESEQILRTGESSEVAIPINSHLTGGFKLTLDAPEYQAFRFTLASGEFPALSRDATIELVRK